MWAVIVHGGAEAIASDKHDAFRRGCLAAVQTAAAILAQGRSSVDAVEAAVRYFEEDPTFNAGYGSARNQAGEVEMCAALMEGSGLNVGAVSAIQGVRHPVSVARRVLPEKEILLTAHGAREFAELHGLELCDPADLIVEQELERAADTVGAVAIDDRGLIAVATSTGGLDGKPVGRVGDSPQPGCGYYADNRLGGVAFSGDGEHIARTILAATVMHALPQRSPHDAVQLAIDKVRAIGGEAGGILLTPSGEFGWLHNSGDFAVAFHRSDQERPNVFLNKAEEAARNGR